MEKRFSSIFSKAGKAAAGAASQAYWSTKLQVNISEAKKLSDPGDSNYFAALAVDDELVARTSTVWRCNSSPFFGEEFHLNLHNKFKSLRIYIFNHDKPDDPVGKIDFGRKNFVDSANIDGWFPLVKPTSATESKGEVLVELLLSETANGLDHLTVTTVAARDLCAKDTTSKCDSFAKVILDAQEVATDKIKGTRYPAYDKTFQFERAKLGPSVTVQVCDGGVVIGEAVIMLNTLEQDIPSRNWYRLMPTATSVKKFGEGYGSIRVRLKYTNELILPLASYSSLVSLLQSHVKAEAGIKSGIVAILEELLADPTFQVSDREQVAMMLVRILLYCNSSVVFLKTLNDIEISRSRDSSTLFRGNSMATKCTDQFMKIAGMQYLHTTIKRVIDQIFKDRKYCEIDETKLTKKYTKADIPKHVDILTEYLEMIFKCIFSSVDKCPPAMRSVFKHLQEGAQKNKALGADAAYTVVSGFLFLRFFAPAVLSPKLFGMREELADETTTRTLTLLAKALQSVGNLGSTMESGKEPYMKPLHPVFKKHLPMVKRFIDGICSVGVPTGPEHAQTLSKTVVAQAELNVRGDKDADIVPKSFKKRHVLLTAEYLAVSKSPDPGAPDQKVQLAAVILLETLEATAFGNKYVIAIQERDSPNAVYLSFASKSDQVRWLQDIRKARENVGPKALASIVPSYCPGVSSKGKWSCCKRKEDSAMGRLNGCAKSHCTIAVDQFADNPAPEIWAHKLFAILLSGKPKLEAKYPNLGGTDKAKAGELGKLYHVLDDINLAHLLHQDNE